MKKSTVAGTGILLVILLALVTIAYNLEPSQEVKRVGWVLNFQWNRVVATTGNVQWTLENQLSGIKLDGNFP